MDKRLKNNLVISTIMFLVFIIYTILVLTIDVSNFGLHNTNIGFSTLNINIQKRLEYNEAWHKITTCIEYLAIALMAFFALLGAYQLLKRKSLKKVDQDLIVLGIFYILMIGFYLLFNIVVINYRPIDLGDGLESSYPSTHTLVGICVYFSSLLELKLKCKNKTINSIGTVICAIIIPLMIVGRILSGVHWISDIFGSILLSLALLSLFYTGLDFIFMIQEKKEEQNDLQNC